MIGEYVVPEDLLARCVGKEDLVRRVLRAFIQQIRDDIPQLSAELRRGDWERSAKTAHRIKGSAANVAAEPVRLCAERIESVAHTGQCEEASAALEQLQQESEQFVELTAGFLAAPN